MAYEELKSSGITADTPKNILLGAGTIHKNLMLKYALTKDTALVSGKTYYTQGGTEGNYTYTKVAEPNVSAIATYYEAAWNFAESLIGATSGGTKLTITPEFQDIEVDGALVKVKGLTVKIGETASIETNMVELTPEWIKMSIVGQDGTSTIDGYDVIESKRQLEDGDYITNFGYIGKKADGTPIIVIFDYALCTTGLEAEGKNKENSVFKATFECYAELSSEADRLPYHIYTPTPTV